MIVAYKTRSLGGAEETSMSGRAAKLRVLDREREEWMPGRCTNEPMYGNGISCDVNSDSCGIFSWAFIQVDSTTLEQSVVKCEEKMVNCKCQRIQSLMLRALRFLTLHVTQDRDICRAKPSASTAMVQHYAL